MENLISLFINSVFVGNILLAYFLGMCSFLAISKNLKTATGLGLSVIFVLTLTTPVNWLIYRFLLAPGALAWAGLPSVNLSFLKLVLFIATIAAIVQALEMVIDRYSPALYTALGVFLPLITVNCAILGASLFMVERGYGFTESVVYGFGNDRWIGNPLYPHFHNFNPVFGGSPFVAVCFDITLNLGQLNLFRFSVDDIVKRIFTQHASQL